MLLGGEEGDRVGVPLLAQLGDERGAGQTAADHHDTHAVRRCNRSPWVAACPEAADSGAWDVVMGCSFQKRRISLIEHLSLSFVNACIFCRVTDVETLGLLAEPTRRTLYEYVVGQGCATGREEAAAGVGVPVHTAKFHLDKLVEAGLLEVEFHKLTGRTGPGSGRPSKHYRAARGELMVAIPPRQYDLLSTLLADAIVEAAATGESAAVVASRIAYDAGLAVGESRATAGLTGALAEAVTTLRKPTEGDPAQLSLPPGRRPPQTEFVCGLNLDYVRGVLDGVGDGRTACLAPLEGGCCVRVES